MKRKAGAITGIGNTLLQVVQRIRGMDRERRMRADSAVDVMLGFRLTVTRESYQVSSLVQELEKLPAISGMGPTPFDNLANAY